ncbi:MAG: MBL fold metallo-hydrolase [Eubacteriaceae bacterium]|jgi:phosphoribosyl 1,2-cyclic phosphodiesterase|nr:MBL fold metallo-hydrolase [Eubacteriaceae bacterium]
MKFVSLSSGSSGNCYYIETKSTKLLIDAGISTRRIKNELAKLQVDVADLDGVCITHEHIDHVYGIDVLSRTYQIPIYANVLTARRIFENGHMKDTEQMCCFQKSFLIKDVKINSFEIFHDAVCPVGYTIEDGQTSISVLTDSGCITENMYQAIKKSKTVLLESNHDVEMLKTGPYPYLTKQRILSEVGHLSNVDAAQTAVRLVKDGVQNIIFGHVSSTNNCYELVYENALHYMRMYEIDVHKDVHVDVVRKNVLSRSYIF